MDLARMKAKCARLQWSLDEIDWDAPGRISQSEAARLEGFLGDVVWIEYIAQPIFQAMARNVEDEDLREIYESFARDERRHAEAEMELMHRWGLLKRGMMPSPNLNIRVLFDQLSKHCHELHPSILSSIIPVLELVLDGALIRYLSEAVDDPVFHRAFDLINRDESRHLAIDFHVLSQCGQDASMGWHARNISGALINPHILMAFIFGLMPYLARAWNNLAYMGMDLKLVKKMLRRYVDLGDSDAGVARNPCYRVVRRYAAHLERGELRFEHFLVELSDAVAGRISSPLFRSN